MDRRGNVTELAYYPPKPAKPHKILRIPGSHTLYVGPGSCSRRHAIHAAQYGDWHDVSFLLLSESDIALGRYELAVSAAVSELIEILPAPPGILFIAVFCIDEFLGIDEQSFLDNLHTEFPGVRFALNHIDPVNMDSERTMGKRQITNLYAFLKPKERDNGINFLGNFIPLDAGCEFLELLRQWDIGPIREIFRCSDFEQYQAMAASKLSIVMRFAALDGAELIRGNLGTPYYFFPALYDATEVTKSYTEIARLLGVSRPDLSGMEQQAERDCLETARLLDGLPIALDSGAFLMPFAAAKALLGYGFNVRHILRSRHKYDADADARDYIIANCRGVQILQKDAYPDTGATPELGKCLAIGADAARVIRAEYVADVWHDEGYFGYHGIHKLMALLRGTMSAPLE